LPPGAMQIPANRFLVRNLSSLWRFPSRSSRLRIATRLSTGD
jgi:hypothetical protein